jgi:hypothetical protein
LNSVLLDTFFYKKIIKLKRFKKVKFADQDIVNLFVEQIEEIIDLFDIEINECMVTDESMISDFEGLGRNKEKSNKFKEKYGFVPDNKQYLYEIAQKMVCKRKQ